MGLQLCKEQPKTLHFLQTESNVSSHMLDRPENTKEISIVIPELHPTIQNLLDAHLFKTEIQEKQHLFKIKCFNLNIYEGEVDNNELPNGFGKMHKYDGSLFIGNFTEGVAEGFGAYLRTDGCYYLGDFHKNKADTAKGKFVFNKFTYEGGFKQNCFSGEGRQSGQTYFFSGTYENGIKKYGQMRWWSQKDPKSEYSYCGSFDTEGKFAGESILKQPMGEYIGTFIKGKKSGKGSYTHSSNLKYVGEYYDGFKEGFGEVFELESNTRLFKGNWKKGLPHGLGIRYDGKSEVTVQFHEGINKSNLQEQYSKML